MKDKNNLVQVIKKNDALAINSNFNAKKAFELRHDFKLEGNRVGVRSVNVSSDNRFLIITFESNEGKICVMDLKKLDFLPHQYKGHTDSVRLTSITNDNKAFYTASWDGSSRRFDIDSGKCTKIFSGFGRSPSCFLDPKQKYLFTASYDSDYNLGWNNTGRCWDTSVGKTIQMYKHVGRREGIECIDIAYDLGKVYTGSDDGIAYKWNIRGNKPILKFFAIRGSIRKVAVSASYFVAACTDGFVRVHNKFSGEEYVNIFHGNTDVRDVRISKDESRLWSAAEDGSIACFNLMTCKLIYQRKPHSSSIWSICIMNGEKILVTGCNDGSVSFLSCDTGQTIATLLNLRSNNEFLIICPPDKIFPNGFFYTTNKDLIEVIIADKKKLTPKILDLDDPRREAYINKLNLKNLVIIRLKNNGHYPTLTEQYIRNQKIISSARNPKLPLLLKI